MTSTNNTTAAKTITVEMTEAEMLETAKKLSRQRKYRKNYNTGDYITDKSVVCIGGVNYIKYKAGGVAKMRIAREGEDISGLAVKTLS
jgi:hypothetical protein